MTSNIPYSVGQDNCSIKYRTITGEVVLCGNIRQDQCTKKPIKISFLGDKVLFHESPSEDTGIVFTLGKVVDLINDPYQKDDYQKQVRIIQGNLGGSAKAGAFREGDIVRIGWKAIVSARHITDARGLSVTVRTDSCSNSCQFLDFDYYAFNNSKYNRSDKDMHLVRQECRFEK